MTLTKSCLQCGKALHGRLDKKFCDDQCRSNFNNQLNSDVTNTMRNINYILRKNRRILEALLPQSGKTKICKDKLSEVGFDFRYFTHYHKNQKGTIYKACYDFSYMSLEDNQVLLIHCKNKKPVKFKNLRNQPLTEQETSLNIALVKEFQDNTIRAITK